MYAKILKFKSENTKFLTTLKTKKKKKLPWQEVPMDIDKINASLEATRKKE